MPAEAFINAEELRELSGPSNETNVRMAVGCVSYCWEHPSHPDPEGNMLLTLNDVLEDCYHKKTEAKKEAHGGFGYAGFPDELPVALDPPEKKGKLSKFHI